MTKGPGKSPQPADDGDPQPLPTMTPIPPRVVDRVDTGQLQHFVTTIKSAEAQVGENIIKALHHAETVAVLTTVVQGPDGRQRVVSAALNPNMMDEVEKVLLAAQNEREEEEPCVGFHCLVKPKKKNSDGQPPAGEAKA